MRDLSAVSVAMGRSQVTIAVSFPGSAGLSLDAGHLIFGGSVSEINRRSRFCAGRKTIHTNSNIVSGKSSCENRIKRNMKAERDSGFSPKAAGAGNDACFCVTVRLDTQWSWLMKQ